MVAGSRYLLMALLFVAGGVRAGSNPAVNSAPTLVFASDRTGESAIYATDPASGRLSQVVPAWAEQPVPAPDGSAVVYTGWDPVGGAGVFVARPSVAPIRLAGCDGLRGLPTSGSWSPDSRNFVCAGHGFIEVVAADGTKAEVIASGDFTLPAWSPDGHWIAFEDPCAVCHGQGGLWVIPSSGGIPRQLTSTDIDGTLAWSPDSAQVAFFEPSSNYQSQTLFAVALDGTPAERLIGNVGARTGDELSASWSPDGRSIAVGSERGLVAFDLASRTARMLTHDAGESPAWSPNGTELAYVVPRTRDESIWDIAVVGSDGSGLRLLTSAFPDGGSNTSPAWSRAPLENPLIRPTVPVVDIRDSHELPLPVPVTTLVAQGKRSAFSAGQLGCYTRVWDGSRPPVPIASCDRKPCVYAFGPGPSLLADGTVAWTCQSPGQNQYQSIRLAHEPYREHKQIAFFYADDTGGDSVDAMAAAGTTLVFEVSTTDANGTILRRSTYVLNTKHQLGEACPDDGGTESPGATLGCRQLADAMNCRLLDGAQDAIAVGCQGQVRLLNTAGSPIHSWSVSTPTVSAAINGHTLLILDGRDLRDYDTHTGHLLNEHQLPADIMPATLAGVAPNLAAYLRGTAIHLIRLSNGLDVALRPADAAAGVVAHLDSAGLFYAYERAHSAKPGRAGFVPTGSLDHVLAATHTTSRTPATPAPGAAENARDRATST